MSEIFERYLRSTHYIDCDHPDVEKFACLNTDGIQSQIDKAISLYFAVRDGIRYDPYSLIMNDDSFKASSVLAIKRAFCVPKAILLAASCRIVGIPSKLGFADVRNHLTSERLKQAMGTDVFAFHGNVSLYLEEKWVKCTPAFNLSLCEKANIMPLDFDGRQDSLFHPFDSKGKRHMEYIKDHGDFDDFPLDRLLESYKEHYPHFFENLDTASTGFGGLTGDFDSEVIKQ